MDVQLHPVLIFCCLVFISAAHPAAQQTKDSQNPPFTIDVTVNRLLVPVVVRDKQGHAVSDLQREDFHVFDNGKPASVSVFIVEKWAATGSHSEHNSAVPALSQAVPIAAPPHPSRHRFIVLLMDDMHLEFGDLVHAQKAAVKALDQVLAESDEAVVISLSGKTNSGLTHDRATLQKAIMSLKAQSLFRPENNDCPKIDYYQADLIENEHNPAALQDAEQQVAFCNPRMPQNMLENAAEVAARLALASGQQDVQVSFASIGAVLQAMATLPGQSTLILVSPGFLTITPEARNAESRIIDLAAADNITVSALDARGVYVTEANASDNAVDRSPNEIGELRNSSMRATGNVMSELADGTGGTYVSHSNDLDGGFKRLTEAPECVYLLELPLGDVKANGSFHRLKVTVDRDGLQLETRHGYFAPKTTKDKK